MPPGSVGDLLLAGIVMGVARGEVWMLPWLSGLPVVPPARRNLLPERPPDFDPDPWLARIGMTPIEAAA